MSDAERIAELEEALRPFAEYAGWLCGVPNACPVTTNPGLLLKQNLTVGDCRRAARVLGANKTKTERRASLIDFY